MKRKRHLFTFLFFLSLITSLATAQELRTITLVVDTQNPANSYFLGDPNTPTNQHVDNVNVGDFIKWEGRSIDGNEEIYIIRIKQKSQNGGRRIFGFGRTEMENIKGRPQIRGQRERPSERSVKAVVRNSTVDDQGNNVPFRYTIIYTLGPPQPNDRTPNPINGIEIDPIIETNY